MRFQHFAPFAFLLLLPFAASDNVIDPKLEGMADICFCVDIIYENLADANKGLQRARDFIGKPEGIQKQLNIPEGKHRLAVVKMDHNGYKVLMYLNETNVPKQLQTISETHFKDELDQKTTRTAPLTEIFANIKKEVFTPEKGDRAAPNVIIYVHLDDEKYFKDFQHNKPYLDAGFDIVIGLTTYKWVKSNRNDGDPSFFRLFDKGTWHELDFIWDSGSTHWHLNKWVGDLTNMCNKQSTYNYTDCYYVKDPTTAGDSCGKFKLFKPSAGATYPDYCWSGEFWEMEATSTCKKEDCDKTCEPLPYDAGGQCDAECNKKGKITKKYKGDKKEGKFCKKQEDCTGACTSTAKPTPKKSTPKINGQPQATSDGSANPAPDSGLPIWAWAAIGGGIAAVVITVLIIVVSCVFLKKKRKSSTKGKGKNKKDEKSVRRGGNVSDRSDMAPRGRDQGQKKKGPKEASEISQRGSTTRDMSMTGRSTSRFTSRRR